MRKEILCFDGAIGTELLKFKEQYSFQFTDELNLLSPAVVRQLHLDYLSSGAQVISTNTFNANLGTLSHLGSSAVYEINLKGAQLASSVVDKYNSTADLLYVAGVVGPINDPKANRNEVVRAYSISVKGLLDGGVDCFLIETSLSTEEVLGAIDAIRQVSTKPIWISLYMSTLGTLFSGEQFTSFLSQLPKSTVNGLGFNCIPISDCKSLELFYKEIKMWDDSIALSLHPNVDNSKLLSTVEFNNMAQTVARYALDNQLSIVGGCCGTTPYYIRELNRSLQNN